MRFYSITLLTVALLFFVTPMIYQVSFADNTSTVAVLDFESIGSENYLGKAVAEIMRTELVGTERFRVVERAQINKALTEQTLQLSGAIDNNNAVQLGKLLGADLIIVGSVVKIGSAYTINSRMIDVATGEAQLGRNATGNDLNLLTSLSRELIDGLFGGGQEEAALPAAAEPAIAIAEPQHPAQSLPKSTPAPALFNTGITTWNFETGDLAGWQATGEVFVNQPTYGDNPTARKRGQSSSHEGDFWIGGYENRPDPSSPPGATQGDGPQGTLTSAPFVIASKRIGFLIGGGCDMNAVRAELLIGSRVVRSSTGRCNETMEKDEWDVTGFAGQTARIRLIDQSSGGWGHLNFDDVRFIEAAAAVSPQKTDDVPVISWDFEDPELPGWQRSGEAFARQPTYGDNPSARNRGQPSRHQGDYWIGGFENRPGPASAPGTTQGDGPQGVLTSSLFTIKAPTISFLIGGGCDRQKVFVELRVDDRPVRSATGKCNETMERLTWDVSQFRGRQARILIVDRSGGGWGHINVDDFRFE